MENFNLKKFLVENKLTVNSKMLTENVEDVAYEALDHIKAAFNVFTQYKEDTEIPSNESEFNDIEAMLEDVVERLEKLAGDTI
jgi:hypothetical protein